MYYIRTLVVFSVIVNDVRYQLHTSAVSKLQLLFFV